jgi:hypothetical protein
VSRAEGVSGLPWAFLATQPLLRQATRYATLCNMTSWHAIRVRGDLYRMLRARAAAESRSVAGQVDHLLSRALDREPNTSTNSGGGSASSESIPGESGRGAGVGRRGTDETDGSPLPVADPASASDRAPVENIGRMGTRPSEWGHSYEGQITVDEAITRCPVCNDSLDDERRCVDPECSSHRAAS